jgi:hypothetical protein
MTNARQAPGGDIRKGDDVVHRERSKQGKLLEVLDAGVYWQAVTPETAPLDWVVVWWRGEPKPVVEAIADVIHA